MDGANATVFRRIKMCEDFFEFFRDRDPAADILFVVGMHFGYRRLVPESKAFDLCLS